MFRLNKEIVLDDYTIEDILNKIQTFEITVSIRTNLVMAFRSFLRVGPYVNCLIKGNEPDVELIPGGMFVINRVLEHPELPKEFKNITEKLYELINWNDEFKKIRTHNRFFIESALGSLDLKINKAKPILINLFKLELNRIGLIDVYKYSDEKLKETFPDLFLDYKKLDGSLDTALWDRNLKVIKEFIKETFNT